MLLTQSAAGTFKSCRKKAQLRYERGLVPVDREQALYFGNLVHTGLETHFKGGDALAAICAKHANPTDEAHACAVVTGYIARYPTEEFTPVAVEMKFDIDLPFSAPMRAGGKWDALVRHKGKLKVLEHKTAARIDAPYLERLWVDFQIAWYSAAAEIVYHEPVVGIIYDIIEKVPKATAERRVAETDAEWAQRQAEAKAPGRLKRRMGETDDEYACRMLTAYTDPTRFHREEILLDRADVALALKEMSDTAFDWIDTRANGRWTRNTSQCFVWNKACAYLPICQSRENPVLIDARYRVEDPNTELTEPAPEALAF